MNQSTRQKVHIAIIMDGNGRWAQRRGLFRPQGHLAGAAAVRRTVEAAARLDQMWPDFKAADLKAALADYSKRTRRFGGLTAA